MTLRALASLVFATCLASSSGCVTNVLWYESLHSGTLRHEPFSSRVAPERIQTLALREDRLAVTLRWEDGEDTTLVFLEPMRAADFVEARALVARDGRVASLGPFHVRLRGLELPSLGHELRLEQGEQLVEKLAVPSRAQERWLNPLWLLTVLATPIAVAVDLATSPLQLLLLLFGLGG